MCIRDRVVLVVLVVLAVVVQAVPVVLTAVVVVAAVAALPLLLRKLLLPRSPLTAVQTVQSRPTAGFRARGLAAVTSRGGLSL